MERDWEYKNVDKNFSHWSKRSGRYYPINATHKSLPGGVYEVKVDSEDQAYAVEIEFPADSLIHIPGTPTDYIVGQMKSFWGKKEIFDKMGLLYKRGVLMYGPSGCGKCLGSGTPVLMFDGSIKPVEDVCVGDLLMGPDSKPRKVLSTANGMSTMYRIKPVKGDSWTCNGPHILSLKVCDKEAQDYEGGDRIELSVKDYIKSNKYRKSYLKIHRSEAIDFSTQRVPLDPYLMGLWLGDGQSDLRSFSITSNDKEIKNYLLKVSSEYDLKLRENNSDGTRCSTYTMTTGRVSGKGKENRNFMSATFRSLGLAGNKHIPLIYKINSRENRLKLMAGLFDSDGWLRTGCCEIVSKFEQLANDIAFVCRSLGWAAYVKEKYVTLNGASLKYFKVNITGDINDAPVKIKRKITKDRKQVKNPLHTGFEVKTSGYGKYYGFEIDGDGLFLLGDFTVTHNTSIIRLLCDEVIKRNGIVMSVGNIRFTQTLLLKLREIEPDRPLMTIFEDIEGMMSQESDASDVLSFLDGEKQLSNIIHVATTNKPDILEDRLLRRPGRFDIVIGLKPPIKEAREKYINHIVKGLLPKETIEKMVEDTKGLGLAHLRELVVSLVCFELDYEETLERLKGNAKKEFKAPKLGQELDGFTLGFTK